MMIQTAIMGLFNAFLLQCESLFDSIVLGWNNFFPIADPTWIFLGVLSVVLFAPLLFNRLRLPHIIGIILALVFVNGVIVPAIWLIDTTFMLGELIGAFIIVFLIRFEEIQHGAQWIVNRLTGKKSE